MSLQYDIQFIEVEISDKDIENILTAIRCKRKINCNKAYKKRESEMIDENTPLVKTKFYEKPPSHIVSRFDRFLKAIKEGPTFVCVVCNRCLYSRAVVEFKLDKYEFDLTNVLYKVSVNFKDYICKTCHKSLKKSHIPPQPVCNKLEINTDAEDKNTDTEDSIDLVNRK